MAGHPFESDISTFVNTYPFRPLPLRREKMSMLRIDAAAAWEAGQISGMPYFMQYKMEREALNFSDVPDEYTSFVPYAATGIPPYTYPGFCPYAVRWWSDIG